MLSRLALAFALAAHVSSEPLPLSKGLIRGMDDLISNHIDCFDWVSMDACLLFSSYSLQFHPILPSGFVEQSHGAILDKGHGV